MRKLAQYEVAGGVTEAIIDQLEEIEIEQRERDRAQWDAGVAIHFGEIKQPSIERAPR